MKTKKQKQINMEGILKANPRIDRKLLEEAQEQQEALRSLGVKRFQYDLTVPFIRRARTSD